MTQLKRLTIKLRLALCAVAFVVGVSFWIRSTQTNDFAGLDAGAGRYTLRSEVGYLALFAPPAVGSPVPNLPANWQIRWYLHRQMGVFERNSYSAYLSFSMDDVKSDKASLLRTLDDPDRFVAAHLALLGHTPAQDSPNDFNAMNEQRSLGIALEPVVMLQDQPGYRCLAVVDGLRLSLAQRDQFASWGGPRTVEIYETEIVIDPGQQSAIRDQWHRRLDAKVCAIHYGWLVGLSLLYPAIVATTHLRRKRLLRVRRAALQCTACGYDLRTVFERCPECGTLQTEGAPNNANSVSNDAAA